MNLAWLSDLHLNFVSRRKLAAFVEKVAAAQPAAILLGGDVAEADSVAGTLETLRQAWKVPIYFVLGNHDFYHGSIAAVRGDIARLVERAPGLTYLSAAPPVWLSSDTVLLGADGWGDGGFGNAATSTVRLNDFTLIDELRATSSREQMLVALRGLGRGSAEPLGTNLIAVLSTAKTIIVLTHVPPFREATWHEGQISGDDWLPWFSCRATGEVLREAMEQHPDKQMLVLCGHTHGVGETQILPNLRVLTGGAEYGEPRIQRMINIKTQFELSTPWSFKR